MTKTGDIVFWTGGSTKDTRVWVPAIVTCTHDDWVPGYHDAEGNWVRMDEGKSAVAQPKPHHAHLTVFSPSPDCPTGTWQQLDVPGPDAGAPAESPHFRAWGEKADMVVVLHVLQRPVFIPAPVMPSTPYRVNPAGPSYPGGIPYPPNVAGAGR